MKATTALSLSAATALSICSSVGAFSAVVAPTASGDLTRRRTVSREERRSQLSALGIDDIESSDSASSSRRRELFRLPLLVPLALVSSQTAAAPQPADAAALPNKVVALTPDEAADRLRAGRRSAQYLLDHYDEVCSGGGDNVRRYLGTVGATSGLVGVSKTMKALANNADDIVEYTELMNEIEANIQQADGSSYMSIFVTSSTSQDKPEKYFKEALVEIKRLAKNIDALAAMAGVDLTV